MATFFGKLEEYPSWTSGHGFTLILWMNVSERIFIEPNDLSSNWFGNTCCITRNNTLCIESNFPTIKCYHVSGWLQCVVMMFWQLNTRKAKNCACDSNSAELPNIIPKECLQCNCIDTIRHMNPFLRQSNSSSSQQFPRWLHKTYLIIRCNSILNCRKLFNLIR